MKGFLAILMLACCLVAAAGQGLPVEYGLLPLGDLTTTDQDGPYNIPAVQAAEVEGALAAKTGAPGGPYTDLDILNFLTNTECLESIFDTYAAFGDMIPRNLSRDNGQVLGGRRAALSNEVQAWVEEVALDEQGHVRLIREITGRDRGVPCPSVDLIGGFNAVFKSALNYTGSETFDPYANDINFLISMWFLEEIGSTGDKGSTLLVSNPGIANAIGGLAGSASFQSGVDRLLLWQRRNYTVEPFGKSVTDVVQALSDLRDKLDGPLEIDQGIYNFDLNYIAVPTDNINLAPTDIRGLTFSRTPQQVLHILTNGSPDGKGAFFPNGVNGKLNSPAGYDVRANARSGYPGNDVTVRSLQELNKTELLGNGLTEVVPAPLETQLIASGRQYEGFTAPSQRPYSALYINGSSDGVNGVATESAAVASVRYSGRKLQKWA